MKFYKGETNELDVEIPRRSMLAIKPEKAKEIKEVIEATLALVDDEYAISCVKRMAELIGINREE